MRCAGTLTVALKDDLLQRVPESWIPVKTLRSSQITHCFVQKETADQIEMVASSEMFLWNYWRKLGKDWAAAHQKG